MISYIVRFVRRVLADIAAWCWTGDASRARASQVEGKAGVRSCGSREAVFARMSCKRLMPAEIIVGINCEHNTGARALRITVPFRPRRPAPTGA